MLVDGLDAHAMAPQYLSDICQYAGLVLHCQSQIMCTVNLSQRNNPRFRKRARLKCQVGYPVAWVGGQSPHDVDQICNDCGGGGLCPGACAVIQRFTDCVTLHDNGIHDARYIGQQVVFRDQAGVDT